MIKQFIISLLLIFLSTVGFAQKSKMTKKQFLQDSMKIVKPKMARPQFKIDNRTIFFHEQRINTSGIDFGVMLKEKLRVTLGYYSLSNTTLTSITKTIDDITYKGNYDLDYGSLNLEFIYKKTRLFTLGLPLEFGVGQNALNFRSNVDGTETSRDKGTIVLAYFGVSGTFTPIRFIGLKGSIGYRQTVYNQIENLKFDGLFTSLGLAINFREVIKDIRMFRLMKKYHKDFNAISTGVDLLTD